MASAFSLGLFHELTEERIKESEQTQVEQSLSQIFPSAEFEELENNTYQATQDGKTVGYVGIVKERGYGGFTGGFIKIAVGINLEGTIEKIRIISQSETPGLGSKITKTWFLKQFENKSKEEIKLSDKGGEIDAITGATISSQAVVEAVREEIGTLKNMIEA